MKKLLLLFLLVPFIGSSQTTKPMYAYNVYMGNLDSAKIFGSNNNITYNFWGIDLIKKAVKYTDSAYMLSGYARSGISYTKAQSDAKYQLAGSYLTASDLSPYLLAATAASTYQAAGSYVPTARTLTINGTTLDLSANRTWTISTGSGGSTYTANAPIVVTGTVISADTTTTTTGVATKGYALNLANGKANISHTQTASTISDFNAAVDARLPSLTFPEFTESPTGTFNLTAGGVANSKLASVATATFKGRTTAGTGAPEDLTVAQAKALLNLSGTNTGDQKQSFDYLITKVSTTITAFDKNGATAFSGTDAYTVIQAAINALTPAGARGTGGGLIHISKGAYSLTNELTIVGWEGGTLNNGSQLIIEGDGFATQLVQQTSLKNGIVVNNAASFVLKDLFIYTDTGAKSCLLADNTGTQSELSCVRSKIDNVLFQSASTAYPAVYLKNFFDLDAPKMTADNSAFDGMILETNSASTNYGGSSFGWLRCIGSTATGRAGLRIKNTGNTNYMNGLSFQYFMCIGGYYGIYAEGLKFSTFHYVDIESQTYPVYFTGTSAAYNHETQNVNILGGYISPSGSGTAITNTIYSNANRFANIQIDGGTGVIPILDQQNFRYVNSYDIISTTAQAANISITNAATTPLIVRKNDGTVLGVATGTNTGDETTSTIKTKLSITTLSGSNTGDQDLSTYATKAGTETFTNKNLTSGTNTFPTFNQNTTGTAASITGNITESQVTNLTTDLAAKAPISLTLNDQTASYTLVLADAGKLVRQNVASANNLTVPLNSSVAFPIGTQITVSNTGAGQVTFVPTGGVTINSAGAALKLRVQYSVATLIKTATDTWLLTGDVTP